jgi:3-hydroxyacyl-[acyl-carrier-protein] dehydratase
VTTSPLDRLIAFLPQKPPFLFVDHVLRAEPMKSVAGSVCFPAGHAVFENHLPGEPLVPGVIVIEALAQLAGIALMPREGAPVRGVLAEVGGMRFYRLIHPDEVITLEAEIDQAFGDLARFRVRALVGGETAAAGTITLARRRGPA